METENCPLLGNGYIKKSRDSGYVKRCDFCAVLAEAIWRAYPLLLFLAQRKCQVSVEGEISTARKITSTINVCVCVCVCTYIVMKVEVGWSLDFAVGNFLRKRLINVEIVYPDGDGRACCFGKFTAKCSPA
jgi:hypothetical protein